jgi:hypothetical protein
MTPQQDDGVIEVSAREYGKVRYLLDAYWLMDEAYRDLKAWRETVAMHEGVTVDVRVDWRAVVNHVAPQVLVVMAHDASGVHFQDFPVSAVLPESGQVIRLDSVKSVTVEESEEAKAEFDVQGALNSLAKHAQSLDGGKGENAMRQISILRRILK